MEKDTHFTRIVNVKRTVRDDVLFRKTNRVDSLTHVEDYLSEGNTDSNRVYIKEEANGASYQKSKTFIEASNATLKLSSAT